jgi:hypothetical protein
MIRDRNFVHYLILLVYGRLVQKDITAAIIEKSVIKKIGE